MAGKVIWSDDAIADLAALVRYIAADNRDAAEKTGRAILERTRLLEEFPFAGRTLPEEGLPAVRELQLPPWRLIYEVHDDGTVVVLRIWHAARGQPEV
jgi:addiction module RelE/StbE family toxin